VAVSRYYLTQKRSVYTFSSFTGQNGLGFTTVATLLTALNSGTPAVTFVDQPALLLTPTLGDVWNFDVMARIAGFTLDNTSFCELALRDNAGNILAQIGVNASGVVVVSDSSGVLETSAALGVLVDSNSWLRLTMVEGVLTAYYGRGLRDAQNWLPIIASPITPPADPWTFNQVTLSLSQSVGDATVFYAQWADIAVSPT
jgi:hypothetical protein